MWRSKSNKSSPRAKKERAAQQAHSSAQDSLSRYQRQLQRSGSYAPFQDELAGAGYRQKLSRKSLVWDGASTHGAIKITSAQKQSFWHQYATKIGLGGVIYLPPRTPTLNPIELLFGFIKHHLRKNCPDNGYSSSGLLEAIHNAFRLVRPEMIRNWVKKAGYRFASAAAANAVVNEEKQADELDAAVENMNQDHVECGPISAHAISPEEAVPMEMDSEEQEGKCDKEAKQPEISPFAEAVASGPAGMVGVPVAEAAPVVAPLDPCYSAPGHRFRRKLSMVCMDEHGTVQRKKMRGQTKFSQRFDQNLLTNPHWSTQIQMQNIIPQVQKMHSSAHVLPARRPQTSEQAFASVAAASGRRWAGLGPQPPGLKEQMPQSVLRNQSGGELWEIDGIVEHRNSTSRRGVTEYLVRYKGYTEADDEWLDEKQLETATGAIKEYWARRALSAKP